MSYKQHPGTSAFRCAYMSQYVRMLCLPSQLQHLVISKGAALNDMAPCTALVAYTQLPVLQFVRCICK